MSTPNERRGAPRAQADIPLRLSPHADAQPATLKNISTTGLACHYGEPVAEMTLVGISLDLPGHADAHAVKGVVVRCDKCRGVSPPTYEVAIYFTEMAPETRQAVGEFVTLQLSATA